MTSLDSLFRHARVIAWCALTGLHPALLAAQANDPAEEAPAPLTVPPRFAPPPPPSFTPPPAPSGFPPAAQPSTNLPVTTPPPAVRSEARQPARPAAAASSPTADVPAGPTTSELLQRSSGLVDPEDPRMREVVGLIRIPEMGRNEVLEMLETFTRKPILRQQTLPAVTLTFYSQEALTRGEAITAIESLLALNGIAITQLGDKMLKAVPLSEITAQVPRVWTGTTLNATPTQQVYEKLFELDFLATDEATAMIAPLLSAGAPIAFDKSSRILVTDALVNLQRIERFLKILDQPPAMRTEMIFFELQNIRAEEVIRRLTELTEGPLRRQLQGNTTFTADERTNQLIAFTHRSNAGLVRQLVERLDINVAPNTTTRVFSIRYADAPSVVGIIEQIVTGQRQAQTDAARTAGGQAVAPQPVQRPQQAIRQALANRPAGTPSDNLQFSPFLTIVPDERANTIVASGTHSDLEYLAQLIGEIDTLLAQVRIEVVITEVRLSETDTSGLDSFQFTYNPASLGNQFNVTPGASTDSQWVGSGNFYGIPIKSTWGPDGFGIDFVLQTAQTRNNVTVLSAPTIVTTHNKEAKVSVGQERPVITSVLTSNSTTTVGLTSQEQVQFKDIKLELKVTPLIGSDGVVQLEIDQQIQTVVDTVLINNNSQPVIGTRNATSFISVRDGDLIVLGGLQSVDSTDSENRMALLGRIPVLGDLFKAKQKENTRSELLIFIRPTILRTAADANLDATRQIEVLEGSERLRRYLDTGTFRPPAPEPQPGARELRRRFR